MPRTKGSTRPLTPFAARLRELRYAGGWTRRYVADSIGVATSTLGDWERGVRTPALATARRLCATLHCTLDQLFPEREISGK